MFLKYLVITVFAFMFSACSLFRPPLVQATLDENWQAFPELLQKTENVNETNFKGQTPLMVMIDTADFSSAQIRNAGSKAEMLSKALKIMSDKETHMEYEALGNLLEAGVDINHADKNGKTALMIASEKGYYFLVKMLIDAGANTTMTDEDGQTALMLAADKSTRELLQKEE